MLYYIEAGGIFMWPIFILSIIALGVALEKGFYFVFKEMDSTASFKFKLAKLIAHGSDSELREFCSQHKNTLARTTIFVLDNVNLQKDSKAHIDYAAEEAISIELNFLEKRSWILGMCATVAPQLGLLGTVTGMIRAFAGLAQSSEAPQVAIGISEALYTTAAGLIVGIPCLAIHLILSKKIDFILNDLNRLISIFGKTKERMNCEVC